MSIPRRKPDPPAPYDDILYKFTYQGRDYTSHCRRMMFPVPVTANLLARAKAFKAGNTGPYDDMGFFVVTLKPVGVFIDGEYFAKAEA